MSDLQIGLIALGVVFILLVLGFNWWQDQRVRRRMQAHFQASEQDPLLGEEGASGAALGTAGGVRREPAFDAQGAGLVEENADADDPQEPDPACEVVIEVYFGMPVSGTDLLARVQNLRYAGRKPVRLFAQTDGQRHRARLHAGESYASVQLAVLLANRSGPLTAIEWSQAWARAQDLADHFEGTVEGPDQQAVQEHAARLDDTCAALDTQVGLTLELPGARPASELVDAVLAQGFSVQEERLVWLADDGAVRFTLACAGGSLLASGTAPVARLDLLLDVPRSPADEHAFGRMVDTGRLLAARLQANLVDDHGKPLAPGAENLIDERLQVLFQQLEQAGLPAGSDRAVRVFS